MPESQITSKQLVFRNLNLVKIHNARFSDPCRHAIVLIFEQLSLNYRVVFIEFSSSFSLKFRVVYAQSSRSFHLTFE